MISQLRSQRKRHRTWWRRLFHKCQIHPCIVWGICQPSTLMASLITWHQSNSLGLCHGLWIAHCQDISLFQRLTLTIQLTLSKKSWIILKPAGSHIILLAKFICAIRSLNKLVNQFWKSITMGNHIGYKPCWMFVGRVSWCLMTYTCRWPMRTRVRRRFMQLKTYQNGWTLGYPQRQPHGWTVRMVIHTPSISATRTKSSPLKTGQKVVWHRSLITIVQSHISMTLRR